MLIEARGLAKEYHHGDNVVHALQGLDLEVEKGELLCLMGVSGAGKTTLLNLLGGLDTPTSGTLVVEGKELNSLSEQALANYRRYGVGTVFQNFNLVPSLTVYENVLLPLLPQKLPAKEKTRRVETALEKAHIAHRKQHLPGELSGGEMQRAALARALVNEPPLLLADEPTGELDTTTAEAIMALLQELSEEGRTVVVSTHDPLVAAKTRRVVRLRDGRIEADGPPEDVL